jgi:hypothetical protein
LRLLIESAEQRGMEEGKPRPEGEHGQSEKTELSHFAIVVPRALRCKKKTGREDRRIGIPVPMGDFMEFSMHVDYRLYPTPAPAKAPARWPR